MKLHTTTTERFIKKQPNLSNDGDYLVKFITDDGDTKHTQLVWSEGISHAKKQAQALEAEAQKAGLDVEAEVFSPDSFEKGFQKASEVKA